MSDPRNTVADAQPETDESGTAEQSKRVAVRQRLSSARAVARRKPALVYASAGVAGVMAAIVGIVLWKRRS